MEEHGLQIKYSFLLHKDCVMRKVQMKCYMVQCVAVSKITTPHPRCDVMGDKRFLNQKANHRYVTRIIHFATIPVTHWSVNQQQPAYGSQGHLQLQFKYQHMVRQDVTGQITIPNL
jgi:hypothetical protein